MIIKKIILENFLCYYGKKKFELSDGLNIILGENGEGKTKLYEALEWLFQKNNNDLLSLVSSKALSELNDGDDLNTSVSITTEQFDEVQTVVKKFKVKKTSKNNFEDSKLTLTGYEELSNGSRKPADGQLILDRIFPPTIRRYSMFKGESDLDIFKNTTALEILIDNFSEAKYFKKYSEIGNYVKDRAQKAVEDSSKKDRKKQREYDLLKAEILVLKREEGKLKEIISSAEKEKGNLNENIYEASKYVKNGEALDVINKKIKNIKEDINKNKSFISDNYTELLFDKKWLLCKYEKIYSEFSNKINTLSKDRRKKQSDFDRELGQKEGKKILKNELIKNALPLPGNVPSPSIMQEMLNANLCKVCNRPAEKDSNDPEIRKAYEFMQSRLDAFISSQENDDSSDHEDYLFKYDFTQGLIILKSEQEANLRKIKLIKNEIKELLEFNEARRITINDLENNLETTEKDREKIIGESKVDENSLSSVLNNYQIWQDDLEKQNEISLKENINLKDIKTKLKSLNNKKDEIDLESAQSFLIKTRDLLKDIEKIFTDTKSKKFDDFLDRLQSKSNYFLRTINVDAFTGEIVFKKVNKHDNVSVDLELYEKDRLFAKPNTSLLTSMHMSVLFAISELASEAQEEKFPLIFDAPTSSFGSNKTSRFLNLISETKNQKIILLKDYLSTNSNSGELEVNKEFYELKYDKAFWVKLARPFEKLNLDTINTEVITL